MINQHNIINSSFSFDVSFIIIYLKKLLNEIIYIASIENKVRNAKSAINYYRFNKKGF